LKISITILLLSGVILLLSALAKPFADLPPGTHPLQQEVPAGFPDPLYTFKNNPLTQEGFALGRELFYDGRLSKDGYTSCGSCHQQFAAFADYQHVLSHGFNNAFTLRNAPALSNLTWQKDFHLDGGINHIEVQPLSPITGVTEMASSLDTVVYRLQRDTLYKRLFTNAFGNGEVTSQRMLRALTQFIGSFVSGNSRYDQMKQGRAVFNELEKRGYAIFQARCNTCHTEPLFTDRSFRNIGLPVDTFLYDYGRMRITADKKDSLVFKVPSLRNVAVTEPYMHDGRFWGVTDASNHFATRNIKDTTADPLIKNGPALTQTEAIYIASFLRTLTDSSFLKDKRFADVRSNRNTHQ
jgi:cytochrome c peroxidase